jgi:hypothetical protein
MKKEMTDKILAAIDSEEEFPGSMPSWIKRDIEEGGIGAVECLVRKATQATKQSIRDRISAILEESSGT